MSEWSNINTVDDWGAKLGSLLKEAEQLGDDASYDDRKKVARRLSLYAQKSRPATSGRITAYDDIAIGTAIDLLISEISARVGAIMARTAKYTALKKQIESEAANNEESAADLRFEKLNNAIASARDLAKAFNDVKESLSNRANEKKLAADIEAFLTESESIRKKIAKLLATS